MKIREFRRGNLVDWSQEAYDLGLANEPGPFMVHKIQHVRCTPDYEDCEGGQSLRDRVGHSQHVTLRKGNRILMDDLGRYGIREKVFSGALLRRAS